MKSLIERVLKNDLCSGCGMCSAVANEGAIRMRLNADGYQRPTLAADYGDRELADAATTAAFAKSCPALNLDIRPFRSAKYDPIWGEVQASFKGHAADPEVRRVGSSGGVITALANYCLEQKLVDGVIQIQASTSDPLLNVAVFSHSRENIIASSGSRYAPASPAEALRQVAASDKKYLFIGKPCDVGAVRQMQQYNPKLRDNIPYVLSFMCAGTPSLIGTEQVLEKLGVERPQVRAFRYRGDGWPGLAKATLHNGEERTMTYNDSWGKVLNRHLQTRCKICPDGIGEFADIVCADGWEGDEKGYPSFAERDGTSLILVRSEKGLTLFRNAEASGVVIAQAFAKTGIAAIQPFQFYRRTTIAPRLLAMKLLLLKTPSYKGFELARGMKKIGLYQSFKAFTGLLVRRKKIKKRELGTA